MRNLFVFAATFMFLLKVNTLCQAQSAQPSATMPPEAVRAFIEKAKLEKMQITVRVRNRDSSTISNKVYRGKVISIHREYFDLHDHVWLYGSYKSIRWEDVIMAGKRNPIQKAFQYTARAAGSAVIAPIVYPIWWIGTRN